MALKCVLDTHALIWYLESNPRLGTRAKALIDDPANELVLPIIALAEAVFLVARGKTAIPDVRTLLERVDGDRRITVHPLDRAVLDKTLNLEEIPEMHDRQIAATTLLLADHCLCSANSPNGISSAMKPWWNSKKDFPGE